MGKVFTITEGLENLGAMKTGGQGSVYKGRRVGEITTAIKLLPTPVFRESLEDRNFADFQNEVEKLKKVNENPNPNVVKILSSGVTDTGNFPFIEMEYIEGPELEELIKPPHDPIFTIKEVFKVAEQLSQAIAHCHKCNIKHGDIKSNNVKFNIHTHNYVLLDFGLAVMSDEQRRTSLRHAGAIEFMAPEQNEGLMLFETDVYSFGVILFELLAGTVPFPLNDKGETARNLVRISHMDTPPPDLMELRARALPPNWSNEKKKHEMHVPNWLVRMVYKCLEKNPNDRFANGIDLHEYIVFNSTLAAKQEEKSAEESGTLREENLKLLGEKEQLVQLVQQYRSQIAQKENEVKELRALGATKDYDMQGVRNATILETAPKANDTTEHVYNSRASKGVSRSVFLALLAVTILLAALSAYSLFRNSNNSDQLSTNSTDTLDNYNTADTSTFGRVNSRNINEQDDEETTQEQSALEAKRQQEAQQRNPDTAKIQTIADGDNESNTRSAEQSSDEDASKPSNPVGKYKVVSKAFFHNEPDEDTRREAFIVHWNNAVLNATDEKDGFVYVVFTNHEGQTSKGWLRKKDLTRIRD